MPHQPVAELKGSICRNSGRRQRTVPEAVREGGASGTLRPAPPTAVGAGKADEQWSKRKGWVESRGGLLLYSRNLTCHPEFETTRMCVGVTLVLSPPGNSYNTVIDNTAMTDLALCSIDSCSGTLHSVRHLVSMVGASTPTQVRPRPSQGAQP